MLFLDRTDTHRTRTEMYGIVLFIQWEYLHLCMTYESTSVLQIFFRINLVVWTCNHNL